MADNFDWDAMPDETAPVTQSFDWDAMPVDEAPEVSKTEAALRGGAQGISANLADELEAAARTIPEALSGQIGSMEQLVEAYRQKRDPIRESYKAAQEAHPGLYTGAQIGGGVGSMFIPGLGAAKGLKGAALLGGAMGLGASEADLTQGELGPAIEDVAKGSVLGAGTFGAANVLGSGIATGVKKITDLKPIQSFLQSRQLGKEGVDVITETGKRAAAEQTLDTVKQLGLSSEQARKGAGEALQEVKNKLEAEGFKVDLTEEMMKLKGLQQKLSESSDPYAAKDAKKLDDYLKNLLEGKKKTSTVVEPKFSKSKITPEVKGTREKLSTEIALKKQTAELMNEPYSAEIIDGVDELGNPVLSLVERRGDDVTAKTYSELASTQEEVIPSTQIGEIVKKITSREGGIDPTQVPFGKAKEIQGTLSDFGGSGASQTPVMSTTEGINLSKLAAGGVGKRLAEAPGLSSVNTRYQAAKQAISELGLDDSDFIRDAITKELRLTSQAEAKLNNFVKQVAKGSAESQNKIEMVSELMNIADPEVAQALAPQLDKAIRLSTATQNVGNIDLSKPMSILSSGSTALGNIEGQLEGSLIKYIGPKNLSNLSDTIRKSGIQELANKVSEISKNPSAQARLAAMSALMSNPTERDVIASNMSQTPKDINIKTPAATTGGERIKNVGYDKQYTEDNLSQMQGLVTPAMGSSGEQLKNILENIKGRETRSRNAMMFALEQNPAYRPLLKQLRDKQ